MTGQRKTEIPGSTQVTRLLAIPWNVEGTLGMAQRQHWAPVNQSRPKRKEMKVTGKKTEESTLQAYRGGGGQETIVSVLLQPLCA